MCLATHGNLIEKKIGKHTVIQLEWDVEHQLQKATVTKAAHSPKPVKTETRYRYDAFGRRLEKKDAFGQTLFEWDGNRLLSEQRGSNHKLYVYEADSFAPLAQISLQADSRPKQPQVGVEPAPAAIKLIEPDENEDWQPRKTAQAFQDQMRALQKATMAKARGEQPGEQEQQADFDDTRPPEEEHEEATSKVVSLKDWRVRYYHNDHLGTPRELSDEDGGIVWQATYKAWGNTLKVEAARPTTLQNQELLAQTARRAEAKNDPNAELQPIEQNLRFQGQYFDQETGLHYNRFRYYDPDVGRFVSQDPIGLNGGDNFYFYAPSPSSWIDPWGLSSWRINNSSGVNVLEICNKFSPGSYESNQLARFTKAWNEEIANNGGSMTRRVESAQDVKDSKKWKNQQRCKCPSRYKGKVVGHTPDACMGGPSAGGRAMALCTAVNSYLGGIASNVPVGTTYNAVKLVRC